MCSPDTTKYIKSNLVIPYIVGYFPQSNIIDLWSKLYISTLVWMCSQKYSNLKSHLIYRYKAKPASDDLSRYKIQVIVGYAVPLFFVILTGIVEGTAPRCSYYKPRFLDESCFFAGMY